MDFSKTGNLFVSYYIIQIIVCKSNH